MLDQYQYILYGTSILLISLLFLYLIIIRLKHNADYFYKNGLKEFNEGNFTNAKSFLLKATKRKNNFTKAQNLLSLAYFNLNDYDSAKKHLEDIIKLTPNDFEALYNLALTLQMQENYEESKKYYEKAITINNRDYDCFYNLGTISYNQEDYQKAKEYFEKANAINPSISSSKYYIITCEDKLSESQNNKTEEEIIESYLKLEDRGNLPPDYYISLAISYAKLGNIEKAEDYATKATEFNPDDARAYRLLALICIVKNDIPSAHNNISIAIQLDANSNEGYNLIRYSKFECG